jgi:hypothetical protein
MSSTSNHMSSNDNHTSSTDNMTPTDNLMIPTNNHMTPALTHMSPADNHAMSDMKEMQQLFLGHGDDGVQGSELRRLCQEVLQIGMNFKCQSAVKANPTSTPESVIFPDMPNAGISCDGLMEAFKRIAAGSANWGSPNFMGFPDAGNSVPALCAAMLTPFINQNLANQDICSPLATFVEMETVHWLRQNVGFEVESTYRSSTEIGGVLTLGGGKECAPCPS